MKIVVELPNDTKGGFVNFVYDRRGITYLGSVSFGSNEIDSGTVSFEEKLSDAT